MSDKGFHKFAAEKFEKGELPLLGNEQQPGGQGGGGGASSGQGTGAAGAGQKKPGSTFFKGNEGEIKGVDSVDKFNAIIKEKFNIDVTGGYDTFLNSVNKFRTDASKLPEAEKKIKGIENSYQALPPAIKKAIEAVSNGHDYKKAFNLYASKLDFTKKVEDYKKEDLASYYFPAKVQEAKSKLDAKTIEQDAYDQLVESYGDAAVAKFGAEQQQFIVYSENVKETTKNQIKAYELSVSNTLAAIKQRFPLFDETKLDAIKTHLESGPQNLFLNEDGMLKDDAGVRLALALYGEEEIAIATKDAANDTALQIIDGAAKKPTTGTTGGASNGGGKESGAAKDFIEAMSSRTEDIYTVKTKAAS